MSRSVLEAYFSAFYNKIFVERLKNFYEVCVTMLSENVDETLRLEVDTPFKQFVLMEMERARLYRSFIEVDELNEISSNWLEFSNFCASSLSNVASLSNLLYQRFLDEWKRDQEQIALDEKRKENLEAKIENLQEFQMQLAILMNLYSDIVNNGIFNYPSNSFSPEYIEAYSILDRITTTYFDSTHPRASTIEDIMLSFLLLNQKEHLINLLEQDKRLQEKMSLLEEKAVYEQTLADFDALFTSRLVKLVGEQWWWYDPIAIHFSYERSIKHLEKAIKFYNEMPEDPEMHANKIKEQKIPILNARKNIALSDHYSRLIHEAAKNNNFKAAVEYLNIVLGLEKEALNCIEGEIEKTGDLAALRGELSKRTAHSQFLHKIATISWEFSLLIDGSMELQKKEFVKRIDELIGKVQDSRYSTNIIYLSNVPIIYLSCLQQMKIAALEKKSPYDATKSSERSIKFFINQLLVAIKELTEKIEKIIESEEEGDIEKIENILKHLESLKLAFYFLPEINEKEEGTKEIEALEFLTLSYLTEKQISRIARRTNEVIILIYHAKAYYYASKALEIAQQSNIKIIPRKWIEKRYSETFIKGIDIELQLFGLTRQYLFLNVVIEKFLSSFRIATEIKNPNYYKMINSMYEKLELFKKLTKRIADDCNELLNHKELFTTITENINWNAIEGKKLFALSLVEYLKATEKAILGYGAHNSGDIYKAITYFNEASRSALSASEVLAPIASKNEEIATIAKQSYEYNLLLKELERKVREKGKLQEFPFTKVLELMKQLAFL